MYRQGLNVNIRMGCQAARVSPQRRPNTFISLARSPQYHRRLLRGCNFVTTLLFNDKSVAKKMTFDDEEDVGYDVKILPCVDTPVRGRVLTDGCGGLLGDVVNLGKGGFGNVVKVLYKGSERAAKIIPLTTKAHRESLYREFNAIRLNHKNIMKTLAVQQGPRYGVVVMELLDSYKTLDEILGEGQLTKDATLLYIYDLSSGLSYLHEHNIAHLDLNPTNVFVDKMLDNLKIGDFGASIYLLGIGSSKCLGVNTAYAAPEVMHQNRSLKITEKADIFSLGIIIWQMLSRKYPYAGLGNMEIIYQVVNLKRRPEPDPPRNIFKSGCSSKVYNLIVNLYKCCWQQEGKRRPQINEVKKFVEKLAST